MSTETDADTHGYEDCIPGTFYGFTETENNTFQPGDSFPLRWGAVDTSIYNPLNISLAKPGGEIVDEIVVRAHFSPSSKTYHLASNEAANCTLQEYTWAIPSDLDVDDPKYLIGLFNGSVWLGTAGNDLFGWEAWSPYFYVSAASPSSSSSTSASAASTVGTVPATTTTGGLITGIPGKSATGSGSSSPASSPMSSSASSSVSPSAGSGGKESDGGGGGGSEAVKLGVGVGVGVGGAVIILALLGWLFLRRKRNKNEQKRYMVPGELPRSKDAMLGPSPAELGAGSSRARRYELQSWG